MEDKRRNIQVIRRRPFKNILKQTKLQSINKQSQK